MAKNINYSKRKSAWSIVMALFCIILCVAIILIAFPVSTYIPRKGINGTDYDSEIVKANKYITQDTLVIANRGGSYAAPESTLLAYKNTLETYGTDVMLKIDVRVTKDGYVVASHDETLDRTSNCAELGYKKCAIADYNLNELKKFNLGYNFKDQETGEYIYRNVAEDVLKDLKIATLKDILNYAKQFAAAQGKTLQDVKFYIAIQEKSEDSGARVVSKVYDILKAYNIIGNTVVEAESDSVALYIDDCINTPDVKKEQRLTRTASEFEIWQFYFCCMFNCDLSKKNVKYTVLSLPYRAYAVNMAKDPIVDYAHKYGLAVNYWTVNDLVEIAYIKSVGADGVITDNVKDADFLVK